LQASEQRTKSRDCPPVSYGKSGKEKKPLLKKNALRQFFIKKRGPDPEDAVKLKVT